MVAPPLFLPARHTANPSTTSWLVLRTPSAAQALAGRTAFTLRQRSLLLMAEGVTLARLEHCFHGQGRALVQELLHNGYVELLPAGTPELALAQWRAQLLELCERLLHAGDESWASPVRRRLIQAHNLQSLEAACADWLHALMQQGGDQRLRCLRTQLQRLGMQAALSHQPCAHTLECQPHHATCEAQQNQNR